MTIRPLECESWPANVANTRHTVDFRRSWVPSPEMRGLFPLPSVGTITGTSGRGSRMSVTPLLTGAEERDCSRPVLPALAHSTTTRRTRTYGGEENWNWRRLPPGDEPPPFTRPWMRLRTRAQGREWEDEWEWETPPRERQRERDGGRGAIERDAGSGFGFGYGRERERPKSWLSLLSPKKLFRKRPSANGDEDDENIEHWGSTPRREVSPSEWRAYGTWARPLLGKPWNMMVRNSTPLDPPRELSPPQVDAMFASLCEPDGTIYPDNWIPRVEHHSLPPRPDLWPTPQQTYNPLPEELQLNPFLQHRVVGRPPLHFDLRMRAQDIVLGERQPTLTSTVDAGASARRIVDFWADGPNGSQPATYPGVPRLRITALAEDAQPEFPWPVTVLPHHEALPVLVKDVLNALVANFEERLTREEVDALSENRRTSLFQAYWRRVRLPVGGRTPPEDDGLRRVDYLGDAAFFRGLAPAPNGDGFMLFMGAPP